MFNKECKHLKARARPSDSRNYLYCPDCGELIKDWKVINAMLDAMQEAIDKVEQRSLVLSGLRPRGDTDNC